MRRNIYILFLFIVIVHIHSCVDSQKVLKSKDNNYKYSMVKKWFNKGNYYQAVPIIEDLIGVYKGTDTAKELYMLLAESYFNNKEYLVAAYHYKTFKDLYNNSLEAELASYKHAFCYEKDVPSLELDQSETHKAIEYYNVFLAEYPNSLHKEKVLKSLSSLNRNLELKAIEAANLYYNTGNYRAASISYKQILTKFPTILEYENISYKSLLSYSKFAEKSILSKQVERYDVVINEAQSFNNKFPKSKYINEVNDLLKKSYINTLNSSLKSAKSVFYVEDRLPIFEESVYLYNSLKKDSIALPIIFDNYLEECYFGILNSSFLIFEESKKTEMRQKHKELFLSNYFKFKDYFSNNGQYIGRINNMYTKIQKNI